MKPGRFGAWFGLYVAVFLAALNFALGAWPFGLLGILGALCFAFWLWADSRLAQLQLELDDLTT